MSDPPVSEARVREAQVREALRNWVMARARAGGGLGLRTLLDDRTPLIASRLVTSLQITDLLCLIEELRGESVSASMLRPGVFADIDTIYATFFAQDVAR